MELGSGSGISGIFTVKRWGHLLDELVMTDYGGQTLSNLEHNVMCNLTPDMEVVSQSPLVLEKESGVRVRVAQLDWNQVTQSCLPNVPDIVLGADLVYEASILPSLVLTLHLLLSSSPSCVAFLACSQRPDTFPIFLQLLDSEKLKYAVEVLQGGNQATQTNSLPLCMVTITMR